MHRLLACLTLGGLYTLAAAEPVPAVDHAIKPPCNESSVLSYPVSTLRPVGISTGVPADSIGISSASIIANVSVYTATEISSSSIESLLLYSSISVVPANTATGSSSVPNPVSSSANISSTTEGNALPTYIWHHPTVATPISTGPIVTGDPSGSTAAPIGTGASSGIYTNTSTAESTITYVYRNPFTNTDGISASPTSTSELTTTLTIKATRSLTSTISSINGSSIDPTIATQSASSVYSATGISIGTATLGGITANSTSTIGVYPTFHGPFTPSSYPISSPSSALSAGSGTSPASGVQSLYPPIITGASGVGTLSPVTASIYSSNLNATSPSDPASTAEVPTYSYSFVTAVTSSSDQSASVLPPYPISSNNTTTASPTAISSSILGSGTGLPPYTYPWGVTTISDPKITTLSTDESATAIPSYPTPSNGTTGEGPTATASSIGGSATALPPNIYTWYGFTSADPNTITSSADESATAIPPYPTSSNSTSIAGPTASSFIYPTSSPNSTTDLGSTSLLPTTFVTTTSSPVYPTASFNSTAVDDPFELSSSSVGPVSILTTAPAVTTLSGDPVYPPFVPYPIVTPSVPAEYYYHHRRPHKDRYWPSWSDEEEEDETAEGYVYDDGEDYDYGDDEDYPYK